ncbi:MAG: sulfatase-like hydrolase/transferase [bacterium]|nr:sulfatase-like hydrolase/transferase [bacterium]
MSRRVRSPWLGLGLLLLLSCAGKEAAEFSTPSNLLLITVDTLRADHLSCYGYPRKTSPIIDQLAAEGVRFDQPAVQWPKTGPSFASIFTATYPKDNHIVRQVGKPVPFEFRMLAEVLKDHGYTTHAVVANGALAGELNYSQGFDTYVETWKFPGAGESERNNPAVRVTNLARSVAEGIDRSRPYFLWVHYIDPHFPYAPPEPWEDRFVEDPWYTTGRKISISSKARRKQLRGIGYSQVIDGQDELDFYIARYDAEVAYVDSQIGVLLDALRRADLLTNTLTVFTSDHGESLGEHNYYFGHGRFAYQPGLRVPLIFHFPGILPPRVDPDPVELIHLAPTFLEAAGVPVAEGRWMQGRSLLPRMRGAVTPPDETHYAFSEAGIATRRRWLRVVRDQRFKLIYVPKKDGQRSTDGAGRHVVLYDLENDPEETVNLAKKFPEIAGRLEQALTRWWNEPAFEVKVDPASSQEQRPMDEETREQLKALGYLN